MRLAREAYPVTDALATHVPGLSPAQRRGLGWWVYGTILAGSGCQAAVVTALEPVVGAGHTAALRQRLRQRLREWLYAGGDKDAPCAAEVDVAACFAPRLRWVLAWWPDADRAEAALPLAVGATALGDRLVVLSVSVLSVSVLYRGSHAPGRLARADRQPTGGVAGADRRPAGAARPGGAGPASGAGAGRPGAVEPAALGRDPRARPAPAAARPPGGDLPPGGRRAGPGDPAGARAGHGVGRGGDGLQARPEAPRGHPGRGLGGRPGRPLPRADRPGPGAWPRTRWACAGPTCAPGSSWGSGPSRRSAGTLERTRRTDPDRVARHWLVLAVATLWTLATGTRVEDAARLGREPANLRVATPPPPGRVGRTTSVFARGLARLRWQLLRVRRLWVRTWRWPEPWPADLTGLLVRTSDSGSP